MNSQLSILVAALTLSMLLVALQVAGEEVQHHTRWNSQFDVCVYFYNPAPAVSGHCYVGEEYCMIEPTKPNWYRNVDEIECTWLLPGEVNQLPVLEPMNDVRVGEGEEILLEPKCSDPEGGEVILTYEGAMTSATWQTGFENAGRYDQSVTCTDREQESVSQEFRIFVEDVNRPPVFIRPA